MPSPLLFNNLDAAADWTLEQLGREAVFATPLGLGKPNQLVNALYRRVKSDPTRQLRLFTALSLARPQPEGNLQTRFLGPFRERHWGANYPDLEYLADLERGRLPPNIRIHEFYLQAGKSLNRSAVQRDYISVNYTHVPQAIADQGVQAIVQLVAKNPRQKGLYSLSSNPDLTLDVADLYKSRGRKLLVIGVVHPDLPYCSLDAEVPAEFFDAIVETPEVQHKLFALPRQPIADADFMIGLFASLLIEDGGTIQIGIGSLGEALVYCTILRHQNNELYREIVGRLLSERPFLHANEELHFSPFEKGLYGTSEMVMDGFMHLHRAGILKRRVFDLDESVRCYLHGAFFLGSTEFYAWLRELDRQGDRGLCMTRVSKVNDLYDANELAIRRQRVKARFFNTCLNATLLGGAASDTSEAGKVVSGVGGQYNFVAMSHELPDAFSVLMLRSLRHDSRGTQSNFVWGHGQLTIPRHLRDVVISEYGVAFVKNRTDEQVIQAQLSIMDVNHQEELRAMAVENGKLARDWGLPEWCQKNRESSSTEFLEDWKTKGLFPAFPYGSDFSSVEEQLVLALTRLKKASASKVTLAAIFWKGVRRDPAPFREALERMQLAAPKSWRDRGWRALLLGVL